MATLLRTQDALDLETAIREWQYQQNERQHGGPAREPDEKSAVARLTAALDSLFREIVVVLSDKGKFPRDIFISLDRSRSCFSLWSDGHGVASGTLDDKFQRSRKLRQAMMKTLSHLSSTLIDRLVPVAHISNPKTKGLCDQVSNVLEEVSFSHVADDSSSDSTSEYSTEDVHELAEDLKTDVDCLIELDPMLRDPATDPEPETTEADVPLSLWAPHQVFADKIEHRFPGADAKLFSSLGMVNYQRYLRCQTERDTNQAHAEQGKEPPEVTEGSKFHDSGLGTSLNRASSYAETIMSYKNGNRSIRIPPLPEQAKNGDPFPCVACGRSVTMRTNSQWKRHLYLDLQPYVCLDTSCQLSNSTFSNRTNWLQHLALDHGMDPTWGQIKCPLCGDEIGPGKLVITTHLGRHLEEISLSALPAAPDSESNSEASGSDIGDIYFQIRNDQEAAFYRRMRELNVAQEEAKRELKKARAEGEKAASIMWSKAALANARGGAEAVVNDTEDEGKALAKALSQIEEALKKFNAAQEAAGALQPGNTESEVEENRETVQNGAVQNLLNNLSQEQRAEISSLTPDQLDEVMRRWRIRQQEQMAMDDGQGNQEQIQSRAPDQMGQVSPNMARPEAELEARPKFEAAAEVAEEQRRSDAKTLAEAEKADRVRKVARVRLGPEEIKARGKAEGENRVKLDAAVKIINEEHAQERVGTTPAPDSPRSEVSETTHDDPRAMFWRWRCPACGSNGQDRRKGPVCSNCSYLIGDGDGFTRETVTDEYFQEEDQDSPEHQAGFKSPERAPQAEPQYKYRSQHAERDVPDSTGFAVPDVPPWRPNPYATNKEYTPERGPIHQGAILSSTTATEQWATANQDSLLSSPEPADVERSAPSISISSVQPSLSELLRTAEAQALRDWRTEAIQFAPRPENVQGQLDLMEPIVDINRNTAGLKQILNPVRSDNGPLLSPDPRHLSVPHTALSPIQPGSMHTALPSFKVVQPGSTGPEKNLYGPDADWSKTTEPGERRRLSNRMAQRTFRRHMKERLADLEKRAGAAEVEVSENLGSSSHDGHQEGQISIPSIMNDDPPISLPPMSGKASLQKHWMRQDDSTEGQDPQADGEGRHAETSQAR